MSKILMSNADYHSHSAIGSTFVKAVNSKSVIHAIESPFVENDSSIMGGGLHCKVLNPETFDTEYIVSPKFDKRTKAGKEGFAEFSEKAQGKTILDESQLEIINGMSKAIFEHETASSMLKGGEAEFSYFAECFDTGLELKCRPDYVNKNSLIDVKSARDASPKEFAKACANLGYHIQAAFYLDVYNMVNGTDLNEFYFVVVENSAPFAVSVYLLDTLAIEHGRSKYKLALEKIAEYKTAEKSGEIKKQKYMYGEGITELCLPNWAY